MTITIKNKALYKKIMKRLKELDNKQLVLLHNGRYKQAKVIDRNSDKLYKKYYNKMFRVTIRR